MITIVIVTFKIIKLSIIMLAMKTKLLVLFGTKELLNVSEVSSPKNMFKAGRGYQTQICMVQE